MNTDQSRILDCTTTILTRAEQIQARIRNRMSRDAAEPMDQAMNEVMLQGINDAVPIIRHFSNCAELYDSLAPVTHEYGKELRAVLRAFAAAPAIVEKTMDNMADMQKTGGSLSALFARTMERDCADLRSLRDGLDTIWNNACRGVVHRINEGEKLRLVKSGKVADLIIP